MTDTNETIATAAKPQTKRPRKMARERKAAAAGASSAADTSPTSSKRASKADLVLGLLQRPEGATIDHLVAATGWLPHTTRAALTGLKKKGHVVTSEKPEGEGRVYRVTVA
jgi:hypothetical protein